MTDSRAGTDQWAVSEETLVLAARRREISVSRSNADDRVVEFGTGSARRRLRTMSTTLTTDSAVRIAKNKAMTYHVLRRAGLPVPTGDSCTNALDALSIANRVGYPVVVKPVDGNRGRGVAIGLTQDHEVAAAFEEAALISASRTVLVEQLAPGNQHRVLVVDGKISSAYRRQTAAVTGTGVHTIHQLLELSADVRTREGKRIRQRRTIVIDQEALRILGLQGFTLLSVPTLGQLVVIKPPIAYNGSLTMTCTDAIHPDNARMFVMASAAVGLDIAALDVVTPDITQSMWEVGGAIVEVNSMPSFRAHVEPYRGKSDDIGEDMVAMLFPPGAPTQAPVIAVAPRPGLRRTIDQIVHMLKGEGLHPGWATTETVTANGVRRHNQTGSVRAAVTQLLNNSAIDVVIVELGEETDHDQLAFDLLIQPSDPIDAITSAVRAMLSLGVEGR